MTSLNKYKRYINRNNNVTLFVTEQLHDVFTGLIYFIFNDTLQQKIVKL